MSHGHPSIRPVIRRIAIIMIIIIIMARVLLHDVRMTSDRPVGVAVMDGDGMMHAFFPFFLCFVDRSIVEF